MALTQWGDSFRRILILYGSPRGRLNRKKYLLWFAVPIESAGLLGIVGPELGFTLMWWTGLVFVWPVFVGLAKRQVLGCCGFSPTRTASDFWEMS